MTQILCARLNSQWRISWLVIVLLTVFTAACQNALAQSSDDAAVTSDTANEQVQVQPETGPQATSPAATPAASTGTSKISNELIRLGIPQPLPFLWDLAVQGGVFMIPIALCSVIVLAYAIERRIALRKGRIIPRGLLRSLQKLNQETNGIDPRLAFDVCQRHSSPLGRVLQAAVLKVGRPQAELEKAVEDAVGREADQMAQNIRPINVAASISPLIGLLGTVQGMIMAFMVISTSTSTGSAKGQELAQGIYTALVTTFAGLCVAIPAIIIANMLEGRIERLLRGMEDVFNEIVPLFERFEGKWRVTRKSDASGVILKGTTPKVDSASTTPTGGSTGSAASAGSTASASSGKGNSQDKEKLSAAADLKPTRTVAAAREKS